MRLALEKLDFWNDLFDRKKVKYAMNLPLEAHIIAKAKKFIQKELFSENLITLETGLLIFIISLMILKNFLKNRKLKK